MTGHVHYEIDGRLTTEQEVQAERERQDKERAKREALEQARAAWAQEARAIDEQARMLKAAAWEGYQTAKALILAEYREPKPWQLEREARQADEQYAWVDKGIRKYVHPNPGRLDVNGVEWCQTYGAGPDYWFRWEGNKIVTKPGELEWAP